MTLMPLIRPLKDLSENRYISLFMHDQVFRQLRDIHRLYLPLKVET